MMLLPGSAEEHAHAADILSKAEMGSRVRHAHLEPDSWNISDGVTSPTKPGNEHLILRKQFLQ